MSVPVSPEMHAQICERLDALATEEGVRILLAVESGSRAWGFHSPDSDYDVRFLYARPVDWHLSVYPGRDVIERPISDELDLSGWDLRKTLGLMLGSNAVALEWLQSPICYVEVPEFREELLAFGQGALKRKSLTWHYLRLAERQHERLRDQTGGIRLKRYFYVIRPMLALRWMRLNAGAPPMDMIGLMAGCDLDAALARLIGDLIARKCTVKEMGHVDTTPAEIDTLIAAELHAARDRLRSCPPDPAPRMRGRADALLRDWTHRSTP